jgi:hypothetical protein
MFGFSCRPDHFTELFVRLVETWHMRARCAGAFVSAYRRDISALHESGAWSFHGSEMKSTRMLSADGEAHPCDLSLVKQAYRAYMTDIRQGRHLGTDVELAVWAILAKRSDLVRPFDSTTSRFIEDNRELLFPDLFEIAFTEFAASCPLSLNRNGAGLDVAAGISMVRPELGFFDMTVGSASRTSSPQVLR